MTDPRRHAEHGDMVRDSRDEWADDEPVGAFDIVDGTVQGQPGATAHMMFVCPNAHPCAILVGPQPVERPSENALYVGGWNGDRETPTITPSINCRSEKDGKPTGGCGWHGFITKGVMK